MRVVIMIIAAAVSLVLCLAVLNGALGPIPSERVRAIAYFYLENTFNAANRSLWSSSPEAVNAILWDYRGLDTIFETTVLYTALLGCLVLAVRYVPKRDEEVAERLSVIARAGVKIVAVFILTLSLILGFKGFMTPGGGFQGGAAFATMPFLVLAAFSLYTMHVMGFRIKRAEILRSIGLLGIGLLAIAPYILFKAYMVQNQSKRWSYSSIPTAIGGVETCGTLLFYNLLELVVVAAEFTVIALVIASLGRGESR